MMQNLPENWVNINRVTQSGIDEVLAPDGPTLEIISGHLPVDELTKLEVKLRVRQWAGYGISVEGNIVADHIQTCVVTLKPMQTSIKEKFKRYFIPANQAGDYRPDIVDGEMILDPEEEEFPDIVEEDSINVWEVILEELNLIIEPYPKSKEASDQADDSSDDVPKEPTHRPFADLSSLLDQKKSRN